MDRAAERVLKRLEEKWNELDERSERARAFEDMEDFRLARAQQGGLSMCAIWLLSEFRDLETEFSDFLQEIRSRTNMRRKNG